jgi:hypothetical protein
MVPLRIVLLFLLINCPLSPWPTGSTPTATAQERKVIDEEFDASVRKCIRVLLGARGCAALGADPSSVVAFVDDESITLNDLLRESTRTNSLLLFALNQQLIREIEVLKRGIAVSEVELLRELEIELASNAATVEEHPYLRRLGWRRFAKTLRESAAIRKLVTTDMQVELLGSLKSADNQIALALWSKTIRGGYRTATASDAAKNSHSFVIHAPLAPGHLRNIMDALRSRGTPLTILSRAKGPTTPRINTLIATGPRQIQVHLPNLPGERLAHGLWTKTTVADAISAMLGSREVRLQRRIALRHPKADGRLFVRPATVRKISGETSVRVPVLAALRHMRSGGFSFQPKSTIAASSSETEPQYDFSGLTVQVGRPDGQVRPLVSALRGLALADLVSAEVFVFGSGATAPYVFPVFGFELRAFVTPRLVREYILSTTAAESVKACLTSLIRVTAVRKAFAGYLPGKPRPRGGKPNAPWGIVRVSEQKVSDRIAGALLPEDRQAHWIDVGVDEIIGTHATRDELWVFFTDVLMDEIVVRTTLSRIIVRKLDAAGNFDARASKQLATQVLNEIRLGACFRHLAKLHSSDAATSKNGGAFFYDDGLGGGFDVPVEDEVWAAARRAANREAVLVKTRRGYQIVRRLIEPLPRAEAPRAFRLLRNVVARRYQSHRRDEWLRENVFGKIKVIRFLDLFLGEQ